MDILKHGNLLTFSEISSDARFNCYKDDFAVLKLY